MSEQSALEKMVRKQLARAKGGWVHIPVSVVEAALSRSEPATEPELLEIDGDGNLVPATKPVCGVCGEVKLSNQHWNWKGNQGDSGPYDGNTHWFQPAEPDEDGGNQSSS